MNNSKKENIVVVGGGFAGIAAIKRLQKKAPKASITLISKGDTFEYYPALYRLVTGALPIEVALPISTIFPKNVNFIQGTYKHLNKETKTVVLEDGQEIAYDYVVIALGSETNYFNIPGLAEHSFSFKSVKEALRLKQHLYDVVMQAKEAIAVGKKNDAVPLLHMIIVGGGPSGVELAGDAKEFLQSVAQEKGVDPSLVTVDIIEAAPLLLPALSPEVSEVTEKRLRALGINIFTNRALQSQELEEIALADMEVKTVTVIWTAGTRISADYEGTAFTFTERKRVVVTDTLTIPGDDTVFVAGDGAGTQYSGLAQTAMYDGVYVANAIAAKIQGKKVAPYKAKMPGFIIPIGDDWALMSVKKLLFTGYIPWLLRHVIDFNYFTSIVPLRYVFAVFAEGRKYRRHESK